MGVRDWNPGTGYNCNASCWDWDRGRGRVYSYLPYPTYLTYIVDKTSSYERFSNALLVVNVNGIDEWKPGSNVIMLRKLSMDGLRDMEGLV